MIRLLLVMLGFLVAARLPAAPADALRFRRTVELPETAGEELFALSIDADVDVATADGYPDLRLLDESGREMSFLIRPVMVVHTRTVRDRFSTVDLTARPVADGVLELECGVDGDRYREPVDGLSIATPLRDFEQRVRVSRRTPDGEWREIVADALLFDYSRFADVRQLDIPFPDGVERAAGGRYRLEFAAATLEQRSQLAELVRSFDASGETGGTDRRLAIEQPFRIDRVEAWHDHGVSQPTPAEAVEKPLRGVTTTIDDDDRVTRIHVEAGRAALTGFRLDVGDTNFRRRVEVRLVGEPPRAGGQPTVVARGTIDRIALRDIRRDATTVTFPETRHGGYEIVIANDDSPPLAIGGVVGLGPRREIVFLASPGSRPVLAYGGSDVAAPRYDTAAIEAALAAGQEPLAAAPGPPREVDVVAADRPLLPALLNDPWVIGGGILVLVGLLAAALVKAVRAIPPVS